VEILVGTYYDTVSAILSQSVAGLFGSVLMSFVGFRRNK
jgi:hypothetical protein